MERIDIFQKLKRQEAEAFSKLTSQERQVISQYQDRLKKMKDQNSRKSLFTSDISKVRERSSDHIYSNMKEREERRNVSEQRDSFSRNKAITPQFSQNRSFHNDIMMRQYGEEPRKHPEKVLQPQVMSPSRQGEQCLGFQHQRVRQEERRREPSLGRKRSQEELCREIDTAFQTFAPQAHRLQSENNYIRFRQEKALRNESLRASRIPPRPVQLDVSRNSHISPRENEALSLSFEQRRQESYQGRVRPSSAKEAKPPFIVPSRLSNRKGKQISESAFQRMKEYGNRVLNFHRSRLQRSQQNSEGLQKGKENREEQRPTKDSGNLLTEPGSRTHKYYEAKREEMKRAGFFMEKEIRSTRKRGFTNSSEQHSEAQHHQEYAYPYPPMRETVSRKVDLSFQEPRSSKIRHISPLREIQNMSSKDLNSDLHRHNVSQFTLGPKQSIDSSKNIGQQQQQRIITPRRKKTLQNSCEEKQQLRSGGNNATNKSFMNHTFTSYQNENMKAKTQRKTKIRACCTKNVIESQSRKKTQYGHEKRKKGDLDERKTKSRAQDVSMIEREKVERTKVQLYSIISRLTSHLKICNNFANELEKIEFDKI